MRRLGLALLVLAVLAPTAEAAPRYAYEMRSLTGTAIADARTLTPPRCLEDSETIYVASGHYEVTFTYTRRGIRGTTGGTDSRAADGSIGPRFGIQSAPGRQTTRYVEDLVRLVGRGEGQGCDAVPMRCEGTRTLSERGAVLSGPRRIGGRETFRRGVRFEWPRELFVGDSFEQCGTQYLVQETIASSGISPVSVIPVRTFHRFPGRRRITVSVNQRGTLENTEGFASTATWTYRAQLRLRRFRTS
jgi:hypothetical protein